MIWLHREKVLVNFAPVTPEFEGCRRAPLVDKQFSYVRLAVPLLYIPLISTSFVGQSVHSFISPIRKGHHCHVAQATR